jgi:signal transduction histidine kinase
MKTEWRKNWISCGAILLSILLISVLHYQTSTHYRYLHEIYQRAYYIPIIVAAFAYGPIAGLAASLLTTILYIYHIHRDWTAFPVYSFDQYAEIVLYNVIALVVGLLSRKEKRQRQKLEKTSAELATAYERLQTTFEQLKKADRLAALGQLSAGIAHEIRNPLGSIKGSVEILDPEIPLDHPKREFVTIIKEETARLNSMVLDFLRFARPPEPLVKPVSINELIESTLILFRKQAEYANVELQTELDEAISPVRVDPDQIRQVLLNVVLNAAQAMSAGGLLTIHSTTQGDRAIVNISDTGPGIDDSELDHIFDPFFTTKAFGTGLGLSISQQLIAKNGGSIMARRNQGPGLTIRIELPLEKFQSSNLEGASLQERSSTTR